MKLFKYLGLSALFFVGSLNAKPADLYLYYSAYSPSLYEIGITKSEVDKVFDDVFGPASDELPTQVQLADFYVSRYPNDNYVFTLKSNFNCGQLGCNTSVYYKDKDGDLLPSEETTKPVKCKEHANDKLICINGGYKPEAKQAPKKKGPIHYPAPSVGKAS